MKRGAVKGALVVVLTLLGLAGRCWAQEGELTGQVTDARTGRPLVGASVLVPGTLFGAATGEDGRYTLSGVPAGGVEVAVSFLGYETATRRVELAAGEAQMLDVALRPEGSRDALLSGLAPPFGVESDAFFSVPKKLDLGERDVLPARSITGAAALLPGADREEGTDNLVLRGGLPRQTAYYLAGIPTDVPLTLPWDAVAEVRIIDDHVPARYGAAVSGIVDVAMRQGGSAWEARAEGLFSDGLDAYGYREGVLSLSGPLLLQRFRFFGSGTLLRQGDADPSAIALPRLRDGLLADVRANPQVLRIENGSDPDDVRYLPFPGDLPAGLSLADVRERLGVPEGYRVELSNRPELFTQDDFTTAASRRNNERAVGALFGQLDVDVRANLTLHFGAYRSRTERDEWRFPYALLDDGPFGRTERNISLLFSKLAYRRSSALSFDLTASYLGRRFATYNPRFSPDVRDVLFYGDIDDPANAVAARYRFLREEEGALVRRYADGFLPSPGAVNGLFALPGAAASGYGKGRDAQLYLLGTADVTAGRHRLQLGGEVERRTRRLFSMPDPYGLARFYDDGDVEGDPSFAVERYDELAFNVLDDEVTYYGYDYLGLGEVEGQDIDAFVSRTSFDVAPFRTSRYGFFAQDRLQFGPLSLDAGLRLDVFDQNSLALRDPFSFFPIYRVRDLRGGDVRGAGGEVIIQSPSEVPRGIGGDYAVYFDVAGNVVGYRDLGGDFYDVQGGRTSAEEVRIEGEIRLLQDEQGNEIRRLTSDVFEDYTPRFVLQPRIGFNLDVRPRTLLYGYANRLARQPTAFEPPTLPAYVQVLEDDIPPINTGLESEKAWSFGLGARQQIGLSAAVAATAFYRRYSDLVRLEIRSNVFPNNYNTFVNAGEATVRGAEVAFELQRTRGLRLEASYTLQTASERRRSEQPFGGEPFEFDVRRDVDRRHQVKALADYQRGAGAGPRLFGIRPFANTGLGVFADVKGGRPYTALLGPNPIWDSFFQGPAGEINGQRLPWASLVHLRVQRAFRVSRARLVAYLWIENLFDVDNVLGVYGATGEPDDDGYLASDLGRDQIQGRTLSQGVQQAAAFEDQYRLRANTPDHYGVARQIRLGFRLAL